MDRNNSYFILSGAISFGLFAVFFATFLYLFVTKRTHTYALKKDNYISISISNIDFKQYKREARKQAHKTSTKSLTHKKIDIDDLFSDVWTKKIKKSKPIKDNSNRLLRDLNKKTKILKDEKKTDKSLVKSIEDNNENAKQNPSTSNEVNQYRAKIQAIIYEHFNPPQNSQGYSVEAMIKLDALGKVLDFHITRYSSNRALNQECDRVKDRLLNVIFPKNPNGENENLLVILKAKE